VSLRLVAKAKKNWDQQELYIWVGMGPDGVGVVSVAGVGPLITEDIETAIQIRKVIKENCKPQTPDCKFRLYRYKLAEFIEEIK